MYSWKLYHHISACLWGRIVKSSLCSWVTKEKTSTFSSLLWPLGRLLHLYMWKIQTSFQPEARYIYVRKTQSANKHDITGLQISKMLHASVWNVSLLLFWIGSVLASSINFIIIHRKRRKWFLSRPVFHFEMTCSNKKRKHYLCTCKRSCSSKRQFYHFSAHSR